MEKHTYKNTEDVNNVEFAGPWRRFFARLFDIYLGVIILGIVGEWTLGRYSSGYVEFMSLPNNDILVGIVFLPFALALDAVICNIFGTNLGKYLMGVKVHKVKGEMVLSDWFDRAFNIWRSGFAFGIPFVNLWTMFRQYKLVGLSLQSTYDRRCGYQAYGQKLSTIRILVAVGAMILVFGAMSALTVFVKKMDMEAVRVLASPPYSWQNPVTRLESFVNAEWKHEAKDNGQGSDIYIFTENSGRAVVILGVESFDLTLNAYVTAFREGTIKDMRFNDGGRYFENDGVATWEAYGTMDSDKNSRLKVEIRKNGNNFWRVVVVQTLPYDHTDIKSQALISSLWKTVHFNSSQTKINSGT
jgi:hypothetical protein